MVTTAIAEGASRAKETFEYNDWEEIKETLTQASELFDLDDLSGSIPLLRAVIHECHRFLLRFPDPSVFFSRPPVAHLRREGSRSSDSFVLPDSEERPWHEPKWRRSLTPDSDVGHGQSRHRHRCVPVVFGAPLFSLSHGHESPTALHAALGTALFLFGNVIAQNSSLAMSREPLTPSPYWRAALDVFNAGDNLPCQTSGNDAPDDTSEHNWRVAIAWGRTLVSLAYEATKHSPPPSPATARPSRPSHPPRYPPRSPLAAISAMYSASLSHTRATPTELLALAADQFARGIFHMPHTLHTASRPQALFTLASEVLAVAERLDDAESRKRWAAWADAVFLQMHMEADVDAWRARIAVARGRCWLSIGSARMDEMEDKLERGEIGVLSSKEAEDARAGLSMAISFFDRAKGSASTDIPFCRSLARPFPSDTHRWSYISRQLAEALLSLANLTADQGAREALYARAQAEGGEAVARQLGLRRVRSRSADVRMDESS
ncbi:hypothetical protein F5148DRAFT_976587 [Russula earlei]|uniref:Uncharacterized protein n=1 Tax=Russula earlei TaxID=71964 RepID=A0ACC0UHL8_9AGAM|nr:hypothetical protein F5148DRAFT_976587 [Russula earlei]